MVPDQRVRWHNEAPLRPQAAFVLYWMTAQRRTRFNFGLQRAVEHALALRRPLLVFEPLRADYRWASVRHHRFVVEGMRDNAASFAAAHVHYFPYVEPTVGAAKGLLVALAEHACVVVTDTFPCFFLRDLAQKVAPRLSVRLESVDSCGLLPMAATDRVFSTAHSFRRYLQTALCDHLHALPDPEPLRALAAGAAGLGFAAIPPSVRRRWPASDVGALLAGGLGELPIDQTVGPAAFAGGEVAAGESLAHFVRHGLARYNERNHPDEAVASGLSPFLHFGHISPAEVLLAVAEREGWTPARLTPAKHGARHGWWQMSEPAESFLDELVTWREIGLNMCANRADYDALSSLPDWAQRTLTEHAEDERSERYTLDQLTRANTDDEIWNAAQTELVRDGRMHNYLRMLWGKKIFQWAPDPATALAWMIELNNRFAVDGRDPNSYSGIFWVLGRYDRAWGPERPIFGKLRYMTSDSTRRKLKMKDYLARFGSCQQQLPLT